MYRLPPHRDPELEARYGGHSHLALGGTFFIGVAGVIALLVIVALILRFA